MRKYLIIALLLSVLGFQYSVCFAKANKQVVVLACDIHCQGCCDKIMKNIAFEKGVKDIVCDLNTKTVTVTFDANKTDVPTLLKAFDKINKPATVKEDRNRMSAATPQKQSQTDTVTGASIPY